MAEPGDRVKAMTNDGSFEGILMPGSNNSVFIKLDSGYNIGIDSKKISSLKVLGIAMKKKGEVKQVKKKNNLPSIAILVPPSTPPVHSFFFPNLFPLMHSNR